MTSIGADEISRKNRSTDRVLAFAHIGDLHITDAKQRNYQDFLSIIVQIETEFSKLIDFVVLPGDNADNGLRSQYALIATALKMLSRQVHVIPGDHDMEQGGLQAFNEVLATGNLPRAETIRGARCFFLDVCGLGKGGPDFRLGSHQTSWVEQELRSAHARGETVVVFMHSYPDDLNGEGEARTFNNLIAAHDVALIDMGHTHYNELANDGQTIFAATRSTGQIEEGPVGYSIVTIDGGIVSWRFKALDDPCPFVVITSPADHRLMRHPNQAVDGTCEVRALVFGARPVKSVACLVDDDWIPMTAAQSERVWTTGVPIASERLVTITVQAVDETGRPGLHTIQAPTRAFVPPVRTRNGSDAASIGVWSENGILGTQLGPNRNAKPILR